MYIQVCIQLFAATFSEAHRPQQAKMINKIVSKNCNKKNNKHTYRKKNYCNIEFISQCRYRNNLYNALQTFYIVHKIEKLQALKNVTDFKKKQIVFSKFKKFKKLVLKTCSKLKTLVA